MEYLTHIFDTQYTVFYENIWREERSPYELWLITVFNMFGHNEVGPIFESAIR